MKTTPAVVTHMSQSGLAIVRSLGRRGIPVYAVDPDPGQPELRSRYAIPRICPRLATDEPAFIEYLVQLGKQIGTRAVLYPTGDRTVLAFSRHRAVLRPYYRFIMPEHEVISELVTKDGLDRIARRHGIPAPRTLLPASLDELGAAAGELAYPVLIKPVVSPSWCNPRVYEIIGDNAKVAVAEDRAQLLHLYERLAAIDPELVIQELIPGNDDQLFYVCIYCDASSQPVGMFAGQKLRLFPAHFGSASYVRSFHDPELLSLAVRMVRKVGYRGLCGIEFKRDARDGRYKLIEFNARFGLWDMLGEKVGVDLVELSYRDALGLPVEPRHEYRTGVAWVGLERDYGAFRTYHREGKLSLMEWLGSLLLARSYPFFSTDDPKPFFKTSLDFWRARLSLGKAA